MAQTRLHRGLRDASIRRPAFSLRVLFASAAIAASATPYAAAQLTDVWTNRYAPSAFLESSHEAVKPYPGGGAAALMLSAEFAFGLGNRQFEVRTLDRNGDELWSTSIPITTFNLPFFTEALAVDPASGAVAVLGQQGPDVLVYHFAPDGTLTWTFTMVSVVQNHPLTPVDFGFTASGDVLVAGYQDDGATFLIPRPSETWTSTTAETSWPRTPFGTAATFPRRRGPFRSWKAPIQR